jgi:hypothetical protein
MVHTAISEYDYAEIAIKGFISKYKIFEILNTAIKT